MPFFFGGGLAIGGLGTICGINHGPWYDGVASLLVGAPSVALVILYVLRPVDPAFTKSD